MNYCPYCGASLPGSAVSFCPQCGKALRKKRRKKASFMRGPAPRVIPGAKQAPSPASSGSKPEKPPKDGYDGYYDDVQPEDADQIQDQLDPELIQRIVLLVAGTAGVILVSILIMVLL